MFKKKTFVLSYCIVLRKRSNLFVKKSLIGEEECSVVQEDNLSVLGA